MSNYQDHVTTALVEIESLAAKGSSMARLTAVRCIQGRTAKHISTELLLDCLALRATVARIEAAARDVAND